MVDSIGGPGRPAGLNTLSNQTNTTTAPTEVAGSVTNTSWAPTGATAHKPANASFEDKSAKAPGWLGIGGQVISAGLRGLVGKLKEVPVLGNVMNLVDATIDVGKLAFGKGTPQERAKSWTDLAMHTVGIFNTKVGADYDKGQAKMRMAIAGAEAGNKVANWFGVNLITPEMRQWAPVMVAGYGGVRGLMPRNPDGSEKEMPGAMRTLAVAGSAAYLLPKLGNLLGGARNLLGGGN